MDLLQPISKAGGRLLIDPFQVEGQKKDLFFRREGSKFSVAPWLGVETAAVKIDSRFCDQCYHTVMCSTEKVLP